MKGRRKMKTRKRHDAAQMKAEAREPLQKKSEKQGRLLEIAVQKGREMEPIGRLCG